ncbi:hypothetical protein EW026_g1252 [Hermanssonia centrifuga]|uniref:Peptidase M48 domain-containing protein n=1 Tax=Hermanssonia centrifuga TaxID=98765 RepID=A0A4S4KS47_9APHY|nr:hypothetical protein EW026_g1252 [Hermanssonia centrifuga]
MLEIVRTAARIALTFVPVILIKNHKTKRKLRAAEASGDLELAEKVRTIRHRTVFFHVLLFIPVFIFWATILASLERTPLTGRWRLILLSPEEEEDISSQLAGPGWYQAVGEILSRDGTAPQLIPPSDWRLSWVKDTLPPAPHGIPGPPYALIVVDKSDSSNAFSYGFGPDGGGGIVVFSGFLDDIMEKYPSIYDDTPPVPESSWWSSLFSGLFPVAPTQPPHPMPTEEQTSELAILLAHELSHLILSHHLETLSSGSIIWPGILSITTDIIRAVLFPVTMLFGPFVNDALAGLGKYGSGEFTKLTEYCTSQKQEVEADIVSASGGSSYIA